MQTLPVIQPLPACCAPGAPPLARGDAELLASRFKALADPARVEIVSRLAAGGECCVCDLVDTSGLAQPTVSHHLRVLRDAGLVSVERRGTWAYHRLVPQAVESLRAALATA